MNDDFFQNNNSEEDEDSISELLKIYEDIRSGKPGSFMDEEDFSAITDYFHRKGDWKQALEAAECGLMFYPGSTDFLIGKACVLLLMERYEEVLKVLDIVESLDRDNLNIYILRSNVYMAWDMYDRAIKLLKNGLKKFDGDSRIEILFELAYVYEEVDNFDKVFDCLKTILEEDPANTEALFKMCFWTDQTGRFEESILLHRRIIDEKPYNELAWFNLGTAYHGVKLYEKAVDAYQYTLVIDEDFVFAYRNLADAYMRLHKYKAAIEALEKAVNLSRPDVYLYEAMGQCYLQLGDLANARIHYRKASYLAPKESRLYYKIAKTYIREKQWQSAMKQMENAMQLRGNSPEYNMLMGRCKMEIGQYKDAISYLSIAVHRRPKNVIGWETVIRCLFKSGYYEEANKQCLNALKVTKNNSVFYFYQSIMLFALGKQNEAITALKNGLTKAPKMIKKFVEMSPAVLQNAEVAELISKFKRNQKTKENRH